MEKLIKLLKSNKLISNIEVYSSDESVGIEDGEKYITITHNIKIMENKEFNDLCNGAKMESVYCVDGEEYETQLIY